MGDLLLVHFYMEIPPESRSRSQIQMEMLKVKVE